MLETNFEQLIITNKIIKSSLLSILFVDFLKQGLYEQALDLFSHEERSEKVVSRDESGKEVLLQV